VALRESAPERSSFAAKRSTVVLIWPSLFLWTLMPLPALVVALAIRPLWGIIFFAAFFLSAAAFVSFNAYRGLREWAKSVTVTADAIEARSLLGRTIRLRWEQVRERQEFRRGFDNRPHIRLVSQDGRTKIWLDGEMPGFSRLAAYVRDKTAHARAADTRRWFERL
jgi:hypothetical protein